MFVDCLYVSLRKDNETKDRAVYVITGIDINGKKDVLGIWIGKTTGCRSFKRLRHCILELVNPKEKIPKLLMIVMYEFFTERFKIVCF